MKYYSIMERASLDVGMDFSLEKYNMFMEYMKLLKEWNEKVNLTAITDDEDIVKKHFIDSIKVFKIEAFKKYNNIMDVGTGAGFPGIPISIMRPEVNITLLDSLNKRVNFLDTVIKSLQLKNIKAIHGRAEELARNKEHREKYDIVTSRAVANMAVLSEFCIPFTKVGGYFIPLKGPSVDEELTIGNSAIEKLGGKLQEVIKVNIEDSDMEHNLVIVKKVKGTSNVYPRKAGSITKKPLV